ncbi:MAG: tetratricopeptide repeat protein, partial [Promethearchaeota archaeon]
MSEKDRKESTRKINEEISAIMKKTKKSDILDKFNFRFGSNNEDNQFLSDYISRIPIIRQYRRPSTIKGWFKWGREYLSRKNYIESQKCFENIIRMDSKNLMAHYHLGYVFLIQKLYEKAQEQFKFCLEIDPLYANALHMLGIISYEKKNYIEAISYFEEANKIDPENSDTLEYWSFSLKNLGRNKEASEKILKRNKILGLNAPLSVDSIIDRFTVLFKEEPDLHEDILIHLNELGWQYLSNELLGFAAQIADNMLKLAESINNEKMICYAKDLIAATLTESDNLDDLKLAISLFEEAKKVSETYYSPKIYQKAINKIKTQDKNFNYEEKIDENKLSTKFKNIPFEQLPHYEEIIKFIDYPEENSLLRNFFHPQTAYIMALSALQEKNIDFAEAVLKNLISKDPKHYEAMSLLATIKMNKNELDGVEDLLLSAFKLKPDNIANIVGLGDLYQKLGFDYKAIPYYKILTKFDPSLRYYDIILGQIFFHVGNYEEALIFLKKGLHNKGRISSYNKSPILIPDEKIEILLAQIYLNLKDFNSAAVILEKLLSKDPKNVSLLILKLNLLKKQNKTHELKELYEKCIKLIPNDYKIWLKYGIFEFKSGNISESKKYFNESLKLLDFSIQSQPYIQISNEMKKDLSSVNLYLGKIYMEKGNYEAALNNFEQALILTKEKDKIYNEIALLEILRGNYLRATNLFLIGLQINPDNHRIWTELGKLLLERGNSKDAELCLYKSFSLYLSLDTLELLLTINEEKYEYLSNLPINGRNIEEILDDSNLCRKYGFFNFHFGNYANTIKFFNQIIQENPKDLIILLLMAETYLNLNEFGKAWSVIQDIENLNLETFSSEKIEGKFYDDYQATLSVIKGKYYLYHHEFNKSIQAFNKSITLNKTNWIGYYYLALNYFILNDYSTSMKNFQKVLEIDPNIYLAQAHIRYLSRINEINELLGQQSAAQRMKFYYELKLFASEVDGLLDLEEIIGEEIPAISPNDPFSGMKASNYHPFHFTVRDNHVIELALSGKNLTKLPESIGNFAFLQKIDISSNKLTHLPNSFQNLRKLNYIDLNYNKFDNIPEYIFNFPELSFLSIDSNPIKGLNHSQLRATEPNRISLMIKSLNLFGKTEEYRNLKELAIKCKLNFEKYHDYA